MHRPEIGRKNCAKPGICTVKMWKDHWFASECVEKYDQNSEKWKSLSENE